MDVVGVVVVVEMNGRNNMELGREDIDENIDDIVDGSHLPTLLPILVLGFICPMFPRKGCVPITLRWMCISLKL